MISLRFVVLRARGRTTAMSTGTKGRDSGDGLEMGREV